MLLIGHGEVEDMTDLEAIRARHSVRNYYEKPLSDEDAAALRDVVDDAARQSGLNIQLLQNNPEAFDLVARFGLISGCSTCIAFVAHKHDQDETIGYWGQLIVLEAQKMGLNTCWAALFSRKRCRAICPEGTEARVVIAVGYGKTAGKPRRSKKAEDVVVVEPGAIRPAWFDDAIEAALLAPTGVNRQAFTITLAADGTVHFAAPGNGLTLIDLGIVRRNFELAAGRSV